MKFPTKEMLEHYRAMYPAGTRVELVSMNDTQAPPVGSGSGENGGDGDNNGSGEIGGNGNGGENPGGGAAG